MPTNYLNVAKEKERKEQKENQETKRQPPSTEHLRQGLQKNERMLQRIAAEEKARREAGAGGAKELAVRLADRLPAKLKAAPLQLAGRGTADPTRVATRECGDLASGES